ncbi:MAG: hypothetical protein LUO89_03965 [Methanothrix sp.]|nr:hypothetical protein [Methanothrix sp.]
MSTIIGRDGRLVWDNFPVALKYWRIEWDRPDGEKERWHGKAIISQTDLRAMMEERAKSGPLPVNEPIFAEFHKGKEVYSGQFLISSFPDPIDSNPVVDFTGTGELRLKEH